VTQPTNIDHGMTTIYFIGAGPGDAELITVKGAKLLAEADVVVYAGSLVDHELVRSHAPQAEAHDSAGLTLSEITRLLAQAATAGKRVVRLHTGDPSLYGAIQEQMNELDRLGLSYEVVPGVTSAFAAAAVLKQELTLPEVSQTVIITQCRNASNWRNSQRSAQPC
jgi:precorrin-4/cobalt-precorrin-4 C11-methyltransferase